MRWMTKTAALAAAGALGASVALATGSAAPPATAAEAPGAGTLQPGHLDTALVPGGIDYTVYLPPGYDAAAGAGYPSLYLLHGRGDSQSAWQQVAPDLDAMIADGTIPPIVVVMPDAPWSSRGGYYVDSQYTGGDAAGAGAAVETAFTGDLVEGVDRAFNTIDDRGARVVGGYSMGGAGALRYSLSHQDLFSEALVLSPAVYVPLPPADSSAREFGAYGVGGSLFDEARYDELSYPAALAAFDPSLPVHLFIAVGDDEYVNPDPADALHDLDHEAATLYNRAKRVPGVTAELRVYDGGHDWSVWGRGFREGMADIAPRLGVDPSPPVTGSQTGSAGDDFAGGVLGRPDGSVVQALTVSGEALGQAPVGGLDILVQRLAADGTPEGTTALATPLAERAYGVVDAADGGVLVGGYRRVDHGGASNDDQLVARLDAEGTPTWTVTAGDPAAADRAYAVAGDGAGGAVLAGYTSGAVGGPSAGDKDVLVTRVGAGGETLWSTQFGSPGEDKAFAVTAEPDGGFYVGGTAGGALPGVASAGGYDAWIARLAPDGDIDWVQQLGTGELDQVSAVAATADGVVAAGFTGGTLPGATSSGGVDALLAGFSSSGSPLFAAQYGSAGDDRAAALVTGDERMLVGGTTDGALASSARSVDLFTAEVDPSNGTVDPASTLQFGTGQRDGADEYDESNLFASAGPSGTAWLQAVTYGAIDGAVNAGGADVALTSVGFDGQGSAGPGEPGGPGSPGAGSGAAEPGSGGSGAGASAGVHSTAVSPGLLGVTGADSLRAALIAALAAMAGTTALVWRRTRAARAMSRTGVHPPR